MVIGSEINCLLTELEKFEGVCILTTNRINELDEALERRISLIAEFPKPSFEMRQDIWKRFLPKKLPLHKNVNIKDLALYDVTGGIIKNIVLGATRLAVVDEKDKVEMAHFNQAVKRIMKAKKSFEEPSNAPRSIGVIKTKG
jgi:ATP-dependent 26S proteasome regulatory subunit